MKTSRSWLLLCMLHGVASMLLWWARDSAVDLLTWQAHGWTTRPWTLWTTVWVHLNTPNLIANQLALGALTALAWMMRPPLGAALAWLLAWPLTQLMLPLWPQIGYAVGLAGLLHAGTAVMVVYLVAQRVPVARARRWGSLLGVSLLGKLWLESAWSYPVIWDTSNEMSVVQAAHLTGALWGLVLALFAMLASDRVSRWHVG